MNKKADEDNWRWGTQDNGQFWKIRRFSRNKLCKNIGCLLSAPKFGLGGSRLLEKDLNTSGKKRKRYPIRLKVDLYEVCAYLFKIIYYCYYFYTNTYFPSDIFFASLTLGEMILVNIGQEYLSRRKTRMNISGGG